MTHLSVSKHWLLNRWRVRAMGHLDGDWTWIATFRNMKDAVQFARGETYMNERVHFIRVHAPFSVPKQWVTGPIVPAAELAFTKNQSECGKYTFNEAVAIIDDLGNSFGALVIAMDAI